MFQIAFAALALAQSADLDPDYAACIAEVETNPGAAYSRAARWTARRGGAPAEHCLALAEIALGKTGVAARRLRALADEEANDPGLKARLLVQATEASLAADNIAEAVDAAEEALLAAPNAFEVNAAAAKAFAGAGRWGRVVSAVDAADADNRAAPGLIVVRGRAKQALGDYEGAFDDVVEALSRDPENIDALVLRGELLQATRAARR
ncbi:MAG: hypothetical protein AAFR11_01810 [Pseudomonadota bacterium]